MIAKLVFLLASGRYGIVLIPPPVGGDRAVCFATLASGDKVVDGLREQSSFYFDGRYAFEAYYEGDGAGTGIYKRYGSQWCEISRGGGALDEPTLVGFGVPQPIAHRLLAMPSSASMNHR